MAEVGPKIEIEPRARILFFQLSPGAEPHLLMASHMFGPRESPEQFRQMMTVETKTATAKEQPDILIREKETRLDLPESVEDFQGIVITGSPFVAYPRETEERGEKELFIAKWKYDLIKFIRAAVEHDIPILGICFGAQILAEALGGKVVKMKTEKGEEVWETAWSVIKRAPDSSDDPIMEGLPSEFVAPQNHTDIVARLPEGAVLLAENEYGVQGFRVEREGKSVAWGFQFHPERPAAVVEKALASEKHRQRMKNAHLDPEKIAQRGEYYQGEVTRIFSNFLKHIWSGAQ